MKDQRRALYQHRAIPSSGEPASGAPRCKIAGVVLLEYAESRRKDEPQPRAAEETIEDHRPKTTTTCASPSSRLQQAEKFPPTRKSRAIV